MQTTSACLRFSFLLLGSVFLGSAGCGDSESSSAGPPVKHDASTSDGSTTGDGAAMGDGAAGSDGASAMDGSELEDGATGEDGSSAEDGQVGEDAAAEGCPAGTMDCGSGCIDPQSSPAHCGKCGNACPQGQECKDGTCAAAACDDPCQTAGVRECSGTGVRECVEHASIPGCLEWSSVQPCPAGTTCDPATQACQAQLPCGDSCQPFSIVLLPDTQYYTSKQANDAANTYRKQMKWIIDRKTSDNVKYVIHLGDITNNNYASQWQVADAAHDMLDAAGVPYAVTPGNHDFLVTGGWDRGGSLFDDYFPKSRFSGKPWYGGSYGSSNTNNYGFFEVGQLKFMVISLEYSPRKDVLCWAENLIASHKDHRVIIATHCYLNQAGNYSTGCPDPDYAAVGSTGATVWQELASRHSNVFLVVSGHIDASEYRLKKGNAGNPIHEMVVDYQFEAACNKADPASCIDNCRAGTYTGNGWLRQLVFDPKNNSVHNETFSVEQGNGAVFPGGKPVFFCSELFKPTDPNADGGNWYSKDPTSTDHRYDFAYDMSSMVPYAREDLGKLAFLDRTVNSAGAGDQIAPKVAISPTGAFVAVWEDDSSAADGAGNHDIMVRGFAPGGCAAVKDFTANTNTAGHQQSPAIAMDAAGNFVVVWADDQDDNGIFQIHARGFAADGSERIPLFTVNSVAQGQQLAPAIAMAPDGRFVIAWQDDPANNGDAQIMVRGFAANGTQSFSDRSVHSDVLGKRIAPAIGMDSGGGFAVAWQDDSDSNGSWQIHARGFDASGNQRFPRITVNSVSTGQQRNPTLGMSESGGFVVAWEDDQDANGQYQILARGFGPTGTATIADFKVHGGTGGTRVSPAISMEPKGGFVVGWQDDGDGNGTWQIRGRSFHADGTQWLAEWTINRQATGQQRAPHLALNAAGKLVSIWEDDMDGNDAWQLLANGIDSP